MKKFKMAILGAGNIAGNMARTVNQMEDAEILAIGARDLERARLFAKEFGIARSYGSYEELVNDPDVDLIYVSTPHSHHYEHTKLCLNHGKAVLCEKAFTANAKQAEDLVRISRELNIFLMEAMWIRFLPMAETIHKVIKEGAIGKISCLTANLGFKMDHKERLKDPALAGGALLDVGVYTLAFSAMFLGDKIKKITSDVVKADTLVDAQSNVTIIFEDGVLASLQSSMLTNMNRKGILYGERGHIEVDNIINFEQLRVYDEDGNLMSLYNRPPQITGFEYQVRECIKNISEGRIESEKMPHAETIRIMKIMDTLRKEWGIKYPFEM